MKGLLSASISHFVRMTGASFSGSCAGSEPVSDLEPLFGVLVSTTTALTLNQISKLLQSGLVAEETKRR